MEKKSSNIAQEKSYDFSLRVIKLYQFLNLEKREFVLAKQILRCGTSIGANLEEAFGAQSKKDFLAKVTISYKEARETNYWLRLLKDSGILTEKLADSLLQDCDELLRLIGKTKITTQKNLNK